MRNEQTVDEIIAFGDCRSNLSAHRQKPASDRENTGGNGNSVRTSCAKISGICAWSICVFGDHAHQCALHHGRRAKRSEGDVGCVCGYGYIYFDAHDVDRKYDCEELRLF